MRPSTVITGVGTLGGWGFGRRALLDALREGTPVASEVLDERPGTPRARRAHLASLVPANDFSEWIAKRVSRRMSRPSKMAVAAARLALEDSLLDTLPGAVDHAAVVLGTAFGPAEFTERLLEELFLEPQQASPFLFSECVANAPAGQVGIALGASGPNTTVTQREASALLSVIEASRCVSAGRAPRALAGVSEELTPLMLSVLDRFGALAHGRPGLEERARPFDRRRNGFLFGEGSTVLVVEDEGRARERGAPLRARIRGTIRANDPSAPPWGWSRDPRHLAARLSAGLEACGVARSDVRLIVSSASGSVAADALEAGVIRELWPTGGHPPVIAPKGVTGEYCGGQLAAALFCTEFQKTFPTAGFSEIDPGLGLEPCVERRSIESGPLLASAFAAGGSTAWVVLEPCSSRDGR